jgi:hypothetical protein
MPIWLNNTLEVKRLMKRQSVCVEEERESKRRRLEKEEWAREKAEGKAEKEQRKAEMELKKELERLQKEKNQAEKERIKAEKGRIKAEKEREKAEEKLARERDAAEQLRWESTEAKWIFNSLTNRFKPEECAFSSVLAFFKGILSKPQDVNDYQHTANVSRFFKNHGAEVVNSILDYMPNIEAEVITPRASKSHLDRLAAKGAMIQRILTRNSSTTLTQLLEGFTIDGLTSQLRTEALLVWECLSGIVLERKEGTDQVSWFTLFLPS